MASRLFYGSRPSKTHNKNKPPDTALAEKTSALPRRSGIPTPPTKAPAPSASSSSSLPRGRPKHVDSKSASKVQAPSVKATSTNRATSRGLPRPADTSTSGLAPDTGPGMGTFTEITSSPPPQRNRLRRKPSMHDQRAVFAQSAQPEEQEVVGGRRFGLAQQTTMASSDLLDPHPGTLLDYSLSPSTSAQPSRYMTTTPTEFATSNSRMISYQSRNPPKASASELSHSTLSSGRSSTPSTRLSESPGNFSRTSTPTSASSQSPSLVQAPKFGTRPRPSISPAGTRPPVTRRKMTMPGQQEESKAGQGLPAVRESQTSSSSSSTAKPGEYMKKNLEDNAKSKKSQIRQPAPTPPLRLSSKRGRKPESLMAAPSPSDEPKSTPVSRIAQPTRLPHASPASTNTPSTSATQHTPPSRPSREGTPALEGANPPPPIVQSNLPQVTSHKPLESLQRTPMTSGPSSSRPSHSRSTSITSAGTQESFHPTSGPMAVSPHLWGNDSEQSLPSLAMRKDLKPPQTSRDPSPISASPSRSRGRFGLFSRKIKSPSETSLTSPPKPDKLRKKGPAAGTGHEGYGRYARRGRSSSVATAGSRNRSNSTDHVSDAVPRPSTSRKSSFNSADGKPELDEFFKERLEPITIGGGGQIRENRNSQSSLYQTPSAQSSVGSFESSIYATSRSPAHFEYSSAGPSSLDVSRRESRELLPAPRLVSTPQGIIQQERSLAHRRSLHRSHHVGDSESVKIPSPINTKVSAPSPSMETYDSTVSSVPQTDKSFASDLSEGHEGNWLRSRKKKTQEKAKSPRKWNIFRRPHRSPEPPQPSLAHIENYERDQMSAEIAVTHNPVPVAHYAVMDDAEEDYEQDIDMVLQNIEGNLHLDSDYDSAAEFRMERQHSVLLPSPPLLSSPFEDRNQSTTPRVALSPPRGQHPVRPALRPSRLPQVGRIPHVVSKRDVSQIATAQSFSRPFAVQTDSLETPRAPRSAIQRPVLGLQTDHLPTLNHPASAPPANGMLYNFEGEEEFLRMLPRKDSEMTTSSSSSGIMSLAPITAITPLADEILSDDEIWNEYDELLDRVSPPILMSPDSMSTIDMWSSFPDLTQTMISAQTEYMTAVPIALSHITSGPAKISTPTTARYAPATLQGDYLSAPAPPFAQASNELGSPISLSDLYSNYGNRSSGAKSNQRLSNISATSGSRYSSNTIISESDSPLSLDSPKTKRITQVMAQKTAHASSDSLRFSALMTSRWLSFDRVLFSPAQDEVLNSRQSRILVLDGLGNDDWSAYCALTFPDSTVYNLSSVMRKLNSRDTANSDSWIPPSNLRRMSHAGMAAPFPFPKGFFTAVVLRFPAADTPGAYKNAISECKRVLKPGGHLELCILDIDMVNVGNRARRAIRSVKERMQMTIPEVSLGPASDAVIKLLGRRGFENLNRCFVGVPLADEAPSPGAGPSSQYPPEATVARGSNNFKELLASHGELEARANGPKMMGRVGRWWWMRCYEKEVLQDGERSVWDDKQLLAECEERGTSLRLVMCCAQKPESVRRRTVSV